METPTQGRSCVTSDMRYQNITKIKFKKTVKNCQKKMEKEMFSKKTIIF